MDDSNAAHGVDSLRDNSYSTWNVWQRNAFRSLNAGLSIKKWRPSGSGTWKKLQLLSLL
jgi:hypothetical protein